MMQHTTVCDLGQARLADLHHQAQRSALAHSARQARRARRRDGRHPAAQWSAGSLARHALRLLHTGST